MNSLRINILSQTLNATRKRLQLRYKLVMQESLDDMIYICQPLTHIRLASFIWDIGKQHRTERLIKVSTICLQNVLLKFELNTSQPFLKQKWTGPVNEGGKFHYK